MGPVIGIMHKQLLHAVVTFILLLESVSGLAKSNLRFHSITVEDGLANNTIWDIEQDAQGHLWFATSKGLSHYNGYKLTNYFGAEQATQSLKNSYIRALHFDSNQRLWVGTFNGGLSYFEQGQFFHYQHVHSDVSSLSSNRVLSITSNKAGLWVATDQGVSFKNKALESFKQFNLFDLYNTSGSNRVNTIYAGLNNTVYAGTDSGVFEFNPSLQHRKLDIPFPDNKLRVRSLLQLKNRLLVGTNENLYFYDLGRRMLSKVSSLFENVVVLDLLAHEGDIWVSSYKKGIFRIRQNGDITNYRHAKQDPESLNEDISLSLLIGKHGNLWSGSFQEGVSRSYLPSEKFANFDEVLNNDICQFNGDVRSLYTLENGDLLFSSNQNYIHYDYRERSCRVLEIPDVNHNQNYYFRANQTYLDANNRLWVASTLGLFEVLLDQNKLVSIPIGSSHPIVFAMEEYLPGKMVLATDKGAYFVDTATLAIEQAATALNNDSEFANSSIHSIHKRNELLLLAGNSGLARLSGKTIIPFLHDESNGILKNKVYALHLDEDHFFVGIEDGELHKFDYAGKLLNSYPLDPNNPAAYPIDILQDKIGQHLWVSSFNGFYRIDPISKASRKYTRLDGLRSERFIKGSAYKAPDGKMYFGSSKGFIAFYPNDIKDNPVPPAVELTKLSRFNQKVVVGEDYQGFSIEKPIAYLDKIELSHKDYIIGLDFAAVHHADPSRNRYAYKLEGLHDEWNYVNPDGRSATFTNLTPGNYIFRVKAANKDGVWSPIKNQVALSIKVKPAPWLTWWAFSLYGLVSLLSVWIFIRHRTRVAMQRSQTLEKEVETRTKEISFQKSVIETLLQRKNELFANISHEFRTPLTLILGPIQDEIEAVGSSRNLMMIKRNAKRLLGMVEQILKLTELKKEQTISKAPHVVGPIVSAVINWFKPLAKSKNISITSTIKSQDCTVMAAPDAIEVMLGNLLSNAIKYTPNGGEISISVRKTQYTVDIIVADTGVGIAKSSHDQIFERFIRLEQTLDVAGTGIGLSIVKELVDSHHGEILLDSLEGKGSTFTISLPLSESVIGEENATLQPINHLVSLESNLEQQAPILFDDSRTTSIIEVDNAETVLIIDDNFDMREYISSVLKGAYLCQSANNGELGIELATQGIPDIIICDIMMPRIDGYEVTRRLRDNLCTSHIPIILLTAKGDKKSRIQGWNENIDGYMVKPFDKIELQTRVANILAVRNILKRQGSIHIQNDDLTPVPAITERDQDFLDKLKNVVEEHYQNSQFLRPQLAAKMAVSERQLQRKLKGLVDLNPMDYLRDFKLDKSIDLLRQGRPINVVSDMCGFSTSSHFSRCFRARYGVSPRQYQKQREQ